MTEKRNDKNQQVRDLEDELRETIEEVARNINRRDEDSEGSIRNIKPKFKDSDQGYWI